MTFPNHYDYNAKSKLDTLFTVGKTIKAPVTYKALVGSGAAAKDKPSSKFFTNEIVKKYKWKYLNSAKMQDVFDDATAKTNLI